MHVQTSSMSMAVVTHLVCAPASEPPLRRWLRSLHHRHLQSSVQEPPEDSRAARQRRKPRWPVWAGAGVICLAILLYLLTRPLPPPRVSSYVQITNDGQGKGGVLGAVVTDG